MIDDPPDEELTPSHVVMDDGRAMPYSIRTMFEHDLAKYRTLYKNTNNPIFVWTAILMYISPLLERIKDEADTNWPQFTGVMPKWCLDYLESCGAAVTSLARNLAPNLHSYDPNLSAGECSDMIPALFGFTKVGWNAFNEHRTLGEASDMQWMIHTLRGAGSSSRETINQVLAKYELENERSVRRRIAALTKAYTRSAEGEPEGDEINP